MTTTAVSAQPQTVVATPLSSASAVTDAAAVGGGGDPALSANGIIVAVSLLVVILVMMANLISVCGALASLSTFYALVGIISVTELFAGVSNSGMLSIGVLFVIVQPLASLPLLKSGAAWLLRPAEQSPPPPAVDGVSAPQVRLSFDERYPFFRPLFKMTIVTWLASPFFPNVPHTALMTPIVADACRKQNLNPGLLLMPMTFCLAVSNWTPLGSASNLIMTGLMEANGLRPLGFFEMFWTNGIASFFLLAYFVVTPPFFFPTGLDSGGVGSQGQGAAGFSGPQGGQLKSTSLVLHIPKGSVVHGQTISHVLTLVPKDVRDQLLIVQVIRPLTGEIIVQPTTEYILEAGDEIVVHGVIKSVRLFRALLRLWWVGVAADDDDEAIDVEDVAGPHQNFYSSGGGESLADVLKSLHDGNSAASRSSSTRRTVTPPTVVITTRDYSRRAAGEASSTAADDATVLRPVTLSSATSVAAEQAAVVETRKDPFLTPAASGTDLFSQTENAHHHYVPPRHRRTQSGGDHRRSSIRGRSDSFVSRRSTENLDVLGEGSTGAVAPRRPLLPQPRDRSQTPPLRARSLTPRESDSAIVVAKAVVGSTAASGGSAAADFSASPPGVSLRQDERDSSAGGLLPPPQSGLAALPAMTIATDEEDVDSALHNLSFDLTDLKGVKCIAASNKRPAVFVSLTLSTVNPCLHTIVKDAEFAAFYRVAVVGVWSEGEIVAGLDMLHHQLEAGDTVLVRVKPSRLKSLMSAVNGSGDFYLVQIEEDYVLSETYRREYIHVPGWLACIGSEDKNLDDGDAGAQLPDTDTAGEKSRSSGGRTGSASRRQTAPSEVPTTMTSSAAVVYHVPLTSIISSSAKMRKWRYIRLPTWWKNISLVVFLLVLLAAMFGASLPLVAMIGVIVQVCLGTFTVKEAISYVDWNVYISGSFSFGVGAAMKSSGLAAWMGHRLLDLNVTGFALILLLHMFTGLVANVVSDRGSIQVMLPVAMTIFAALGKDLTPACVTITCASVGAFLTPYGLTPSLIIHTPGRYRPIDFLLFGWPLFVGYAVLSSIATCTYYNFW